MENSFLREVMSDVRRDVVLAVRIMSSTYSNKYATLGVLVEDKER